MQIKVFIVQRADGKVIGSKLRFSDAHALAKAQAPARVLFSIADKTPFENVTEYEVGQSVLQLIANDGH